MPRRRDFAERAPREVELPAPRYFAREQALEKVGHALQTVDQAPQKVDQAPQVRALVGRAQVAELGGSRCAAAAAWGGCLKWVATPRAVPTAKIQMSQELQAPFYTQR